MKLYAPKYYKDFKCIADKCDHSCCIGWEIDVDDATMKKYRSLENGYGGEIKKSIDTCDTPHFKLCGGDRCPHLNEKGLCRIILNVGEDYLCDICREHPRFYNDTSRGREVGIGIACEEACRIVLTADNYCNMVEISDVGSDDVEKDACDFDATKEREKVYALLSDRAIPYGKRLDKISREYGVSLDILNDGGWIELFSLLEYLDESHKAHFTDFSPFCNVDSKLDVYLERLLAYFVFRHCTEAENIEDFTLSLGFCLVLERLIASLALKYEASGVEDLIVPARIVSEELEYSEENTESIKLEFAFR